MGHDAGLLVPGYFEKAHLNMDSLEKVHYLEDSFENVQLEKGRFEKGDLEIDSFEKAHLEIFSFEKDYLKGPVGGLESEGCCVEVGYWGLDSRDIQHLDTNETSFLKKYIKNKNYC